MVTQFKLKMAKQLFKKLDGFSYLESILVLSVVVIILIIIPKSQFEEIHYNEEEINDEIISLLNYYQTKSYETGEIIVVSFPPGSDTIFIRSKVLGINAQYTISHGRIYEGNSITNTEIIFKKNGVRTGGTIKYSINDSRYQIVIQLYRGRMRIEKI
ncbi:hypothetical protein [Macrococcus equi]|uniref:hypothetical protein n=1 Tax=Macrococcus equi TaxID=3395462 RepID=UPI0039BDB7FF